jgi:hypothetical protein
MGLAMAPLLRWSAHGGPVADVLSLLTFSIGRLCLAQTPFQMLGQ